MILKKSKIQKAGRYSYTISLPISWIKDQGLEAGDLAVFDWQQNTLVLRGSKIGSD